MASETLYTSALDVTCLHSGITTEARQAAASRYQAAVDATGKQNTLPYLK